MTLLFYDALVYTAIAACSRMSQPVFNMTWWDVLYHWLIGLFSVLERVCYLEYTDKFGDMAILVL